jgi:hypothetical protein
MEIIGNTEVAQVCHVCFSYLGLVSQRGNVSRRQHRVWESIYAIFT